MIANYVANLPIVQRMWDGRLATPLRWTMLMYRSLQRHRAFERAGGMAYTTLIAIVPTAVLVAGVLGSTGILAPDQLRSLLSATVVGQIPGALEALDPILEGVSFGTLGAASTFGLVAVAIRLFLMVERAWSDVYGVPVTRPWSMRLLVFWFTASALPVVLAYSVQQAMAIDQIGGFGRDLLGASAQLGLILAALKFFPCTEVLWRPAMLGSVVSYVLLYAGASGFSSYIRWFTSEDYPLRVFYGSLILIPAALLWIYLFWVVLLLGVEVAYIAQHGRGLLAEEQHERERAARKLGLPGSDTALVVLARVARSFTAGKGGASFASLAVDIGDVHTRTVLAILTDEGFVIPAEDGTVYLPGKPPDQVFIADVVRAWRARTSVTSAEPALRELNESGLPAGTLAEAAARWA